MDLRFFALLGKAAASRVVGMQSPRQQQRVAKLTTRNTNQQAPWRYGQKKKPPGKPLVAGNLV